MDFSTNVIGIAAFLGSNIDDLVILMLFSANPRFSIPHVVLGQYAGMGALIAVALTASLISLVIPSDLLGLIGLFPIAIGIKELLQLRKRNDEAREVTEKTMQSRWLSYLPFLTVTAVTFSGGEEIGIYASVFVTNNEASEIITIVVVTLLLTAAWCIIALLLVSRPIVAKQIQRIGRLAMPFILIGLGNDIIVEALVL